MSIALPIHPFLKHPRTGVPLAALGHRHNGDPIWPIIGGDGSEDDANDGDEEEEPDEVEDDTADDTGDGDDDESADDDKPLGPKGEKALQAEKEKRRAEATRRREAEKTAASLQAQLDKLNKGGGKSDDKDDDAPDAEEIRKQVEAEFKVEAAKERVWDKVEAKASKDFSDAMDAVRFLKSELDVEDLLDNGKPDVEAIQEALEELLEKKPYLGAAQGGDKKRFKGSGGGGAKPTKPTRPTSLDEAVKRRLTK